MDTTGANPTACDAHIPRSRAAYKRTASRGRYNPMVDAQGKPHQAYRVSYIQADTATLHLN
jgi:hypothetical protein